MADVGREERVVSAIAERLTGGSVEHWDTGGRQGAYDLRLTYPDGRIAAMEVTTVAQGGRRQLESVLASFAFRWEQPGAWVWTVTIGDVRDLPRLRQCFARIAQLCETLGLPRPTANNVSEAVHDEDLHWLVEESSADIYADTDLLLLREDGTPRPVYVTPRGDGGGVDYQLDGLTSSLIALYELPHVAKRIQKVVSATGVDERHLVLIAHHTGLPFGVSVGLMNDGPVPGGPVVLPPGCDQVWLIPQHSPRLLIAQRRGWTQHRLGAS